MPDVDGIELLRFLRGNDAFAAVPVVSERLSVHRDDAALRHRFAGTHLSKPTETLFRDPATGRRCVVTIALLWGCICHTSVHQASSLRVQVTCTWSVACSGVDRHLQHPAPHMGCYSVLTSVIRFFSAVMSANEENDTVFECIRGGAEDYLLKPVTRKEVQHIWQHVWRRQQQLVVPSIQDEASRRLAAVDMRLSSHTVCMVKLAAQKEVPHIWQLQLLCQHSSSDILHGTHAAC